MSDVQQSADWWQASDGKWYPPQPQHQAQQQYQQAPAMAAPQYGGMQQQPNYGQPQQSYGYPVGGRRVGKTRSPWATWGLALITFGVYYLVWWYKVNEEVKRYEPSIQVEPALAMLALFVPIANIVTIVKTGGRISQVERSAGTGPPASGGLGFLFAVLFATHIVYYQTHLNQVWARHGSPPEGSPV